MPVIQLEPIPSLLGTQDMRIVEFIPKIGIPHVPFGATRKDVRKVLSKLYSAGTPKPRGTETDCYFKNSLQFSFEQDDTLSFIEAAAPPPIYVELLGIKTWEVSGTELLERLKEIDSIKMEISAGGANPIFLNNWIALWDLDDQYDHVGGQKNPKWGAIGIGDRRYYEAICEIHGAKA
jgi:hypothetical protein